MTIHFHNGSDYRGAVGNEGAPTGLRERKKARTRTAIQRHALRLFGEQGYQATTVEQVAAAAEVSMSTVFRYFPTKEDLLVLDGYHSLATSVAEAFRRQPADLGPVGALRGALRVAFAGLSPEDRAARWERDVLVLRVPELLSANLGLLGRILDRVGELVAARTGHAPGDPAVRTFTGALLGIGVRLLLDVAGDPDRDPMADLDEALTLLEDGLPLGRGAEPA